MEQPTAKIPRKISIEEELVVSQLLSMGVPVCDNSYVNHLQNINIYANINSNAELNNVAQITTSNINIDNPKQNPIINKRNDALYEYKLLARDIIDNRCGPIVQKHMELVEVLPNILKKMDDEITNFYKANKKLPIFSKDEKDDPLRDIAYTVASQELGGDNDTSKWRREDIAEREKKICLEIGFLMLYNRRPELDYANGSMWMDSKQLKENYENFRDSSISDLEIKKLTEFRNMMRMALLIMKGNKNKGHLIDLCTRLTEGGRGIYIKYITGRGQKKTTQRRVLIYEQESGIKPKERNDKKPRRKQSNEILWDYEAAGYTLDHSSLSTSKNEIVNVAEVSKHELVGKIDSDSESNSESDNQNEIQDNESNPPNKKLKLENILISSTNEIIATNEVANEIIDI